MVQGNAGEAARGDKDACVAVGDEPALHRAARVGDVAAIRTLAAAGHDVHARAVYAVGPYRCEVSLTPLLLASGSKDGADAQTLRVLLELGADPRAMWEDNSAAMFACRGVAWWQAGGGDAARLRVVLEAGSALPSDPEKANALLCDTAGSGDAERVRLLLERGLRAGGFFDAERARARERESRARYERSFQDKCTVDDAEETAEMLDDMCSAPGSDDIPLFRAAESGSAACVRALLAAGADPAIRDNAKRTAMFHANSIEVVRVLEEAGLSLSDTDALDWTPLMEATSKGDSGLSRVRVLLDAGADVHRKTKYGDTLFLHAARQWRGPNLLRLLVARGLDPHAVTEHGENAYHILADASLWSDYGDAAPAAFAYLRELGVDIERRDEDNCTPLAVAILDGGQTEVRTLCELGANPNAVCGLWVRRQQSEDWVQLPLLHHAVADARLDQSGKVRELLRAGADPLAKDAEGYTALSYAQSLLCAGAPSEAAYNAAGHALDAGIRDVETRIAPEAKTREAFLALAEPALRACVERVAHTIPLPEGETFTRELRQQWTDCIVALAAAELWARAKQAPPREQP